MNSNNVNRNLFSTNQRGSGETDDGSECSDDRILDTMARIDTEIRLSDVKVELSQEAETLGQIGDSEEAGVEIDDQSSPKTGNTIINYLAFQLVQHRMMPLPGPRAPRLRMSVLQIVKRSY